MFPAADYCEIQDLIARYCHSVDHGDGPGWAALFTPDGVFEVAGVMRFQGTEQLLAMPGIVAEHGGGKWRHQVTNIMVDPGAGPNEAKAKAYGLVTDWSPDGKLVTFSDYDIEFARIDGRWRIAALVATTA